MPKGQKGPGFSVKEASEKPVVIVVRVSMRSSGTQVTVRGTEDRDEALAALEKAHDVLQNSGTAEGDSAQLDLAA